LDLGRRRKINQQKQFAAFLFSRSEKCGFHFARNWQRGKILVFPRKKWTGGLNSKKKEEVYTAGFPETQIVFSLNCAEKRCCLTTLTERSLQVCLRRIKPWNRGAGGKEKKKK
jgi:hypothetical protein